MTHEMWQAIVAEASEAVKFHWNPYTCCGQWCLCLYTVQKDIQPRMCAFVEKLNEGSGSVSLPSTIVARYQMEWQQEITTRNGQTGKSDQNYHKIMFFEKGSALVPPEVQMMDRKLPKK